MDRTDPLVSYIVPTYWSNIEFLEQCLDSIRKQTYENIEIILSIDANAAIQKWTLRNISNYCCDLDSSVMLVINQETSWPAATRNHAIQNANWELIALLDDDDTVSPEKTALQVAYFQANPWTQLVGSRYKRMDKQWTIFYNKKLYTEGEDIQKNFLSTFPFLPSTCMIDINLFEKIWYFDKSLKTSEDGDFFYRAILACTWSQLHNIPEYLANYRVHWSSISSSQRLKQRIEWYRLVYKYWALRYWKYSPELLKVLSIHALKFFFAHPKIKPTALRVHDRVKWMLGS